jgi:hypothetical protein
MILLVSLLLLASFPAYALQQLMPTILLFPCCCYTVYDIVVVSCVFNVAGTPAVDVFTAVSDVYFLVNALLQLAVFDLFSCLSPRSYLHHFYWF